MKIEEVDVERMCRETVGYFTPERVREAFKTGTFDPNDVPANVRALDLFAGKTLPEVLNVYGNRTYHFGGVEERAAIRFIARFFPKMFLN